LLTLRLIEGVFPNYRQLLPSSYPNQVIVKKEALMDALGRAALVAEDHIPVRLRVTENGIEITATRQDVGGETEQINGAFTGEDNEVTIAFNPKYLMDGIAAMGVEDIEIQMIDGLKPSVIRGVGDEDFLYLLMPVRVA
jgi:DNA polymerase-3 subunit beta